MVFCNLNDIDTQKIDGFVTILILVDGFLQYDLKVLDNAEFKSHNPYFSRWFSAI